MLLADARALFDQKVRSGMFERLRRLGVPHVRDDRFQDAIGMTWIYFLDAVARGERPADWMLFNYCSLRMRERGPRFVRSGEPARGREPLCIDEITPSATIDQSAWDLDETLDMHAAVATLTAEDRDLIVARAEGENLDAIGAAAGQSKSWTCRRVQATCEKLRRRLEA